MSDIQMYDSPTDSVFTDLSDEEQASISGGRINIDIDVNLFFITINGTGGNVTTGDISGDNNTVTGGPGVVLDVSSLESGSGSGFRAPLSRLFRGFSIQLV